MGKKSPANLGLYLVKPEVKPGVVWPSIPKMLSRPKANMLTLPVSIWRYTKSSLMTKKCPTENQ